MTCCWSRPARSPGRRYRPQLTSYINRLNRQLLSRSRAIQFAQVGQRSGALASQFLRLPAAQVDDLLGDAQLEQLPAQVDELIAILAVPAKLERSSDLGRVAADSATRLVEHRSELPGLVRISTGDVPDISVSSDQPERGCARGADPHWRVRLLDRFRVGDRVLEVVVTPVESGPVLGPQRLDDPQRLAQHSDAVVEAFDPVHLVLDLGPCRPDAKLEPAARQMVDGHRHLGEQDRMPIRVSSHQAPNANSFRGFGHRGLQGPALIYGPVWAVASDGGEVVEIPDVVEPTLFGDAPDRAQRFDGGVLA